MNNQLIAYFKLRNFYLGYLLDFGSALMKEGIKLIINRLDDETLGVFGSLP